MCSGRPRCEREGGTRGRGCRLAACSSRPAAAASSTSWEHVHVHGCACMGVHACACMRVGASSTSSDQMEAHACTPMHMHILGPDGGTSYDASLTIVPRAPCAYAGTRGRHVHMQVAPCAYAGICRAAEGGWWASGPHQGPRQGRTPETPTTCNCRSSIAGAACVKPHTVHRRADGSGQTPVRAWRPFAQSHRSW